MAWRTNYGHDYTGSWYARGPARRNFEPGWNDNRQRNTGWNRGYDADRYQGSYFSYDQQFRRPPTESPAYGRSADQYASRWAREHGYDTGFQISPQDHGARGPMTWDRGRFDRPSYGARPRSREWDFPRDPRSTSRGYRW